MSRKSIDLQAIHDHWEALALCQDVADNELTLRDVWQRWLEIETIKEFLSPGDRLLDVGCGNGFSTLAIGPLVREVVGIDSCEAMIKSAQLSLDREVEADRRTVRFTVDNVLDLEPGNFGLFDVVLSQRCLINLGSWENQQLAIANIASVVKPGGRFIFVEGCHQGLTRLNRLRKAMGLEPIERAWYNLNFCEDKTLAYLSRFFEVERHINFGTYDFLSRVMHPLLVAPAEPEFKARINEVGARLALEVNEFKHLNRVFFLVLRKV